MHYLSEEESEVIVRLRLIRYFSKAIPVGFNKRFIEETHQYANGLLLDFGLNQHYKFVMYYENDPTTLNFEVLKKGENLPSKYKIL